MSSMDVFEKRTLKCTENAILQYSRKDLEREVCGRGLFKPSLSQPAFLKNAEKKCRGNDCIRGVRGWVSGQVRA